MKMLVFLFVLCSLDAHVVQVVEDFHLLNDRDSEERFINQHAGIESPSVLGYVVALEMKQAEYSINPFVKLKIFADNKTKLNILIDENKTNVHLRYLRLMLQEKTPSILGYNDYIEVDKRFLNSKLLEIDDSDYLDYYIKKNTSL